MLKTNLPRKWTKKCFKAQNRPETEISGQFFANIKFSHSFGQKKIFGQNGRNFCPKTEGKVKNYAKIGQNAKMVKNALGPKIGRGQKFLADFWPT